MCSLLNRITGRVLATAALFVFLCCPAAFAQGGAFTIETAGYSSFVPAANNLIAGMAPADVTNGSAGSEGTGSDLKLTDGVIDFLQSDFYTIGNDAVLIYELGGISFGYNVSGINFYAGWGDTGRSTITITGIDYSLDSDPTEFIEIPDSGVNYSTGANNVAKYVATPEAPIAENVHSVRIRFGAQQNGFVGYREIEIIGTPSSTDGWLTISGDPAEYGTPTPAYDTLFGLELDDTVEFSMPSGWFEVSDGIRAQCVGYNVYADQVLVDSGSDQSFTYVHQGVEGKVEWLFDVKYRVQATTQGQGTLVMSGDAVFDGTTESWWVAHGGTVSFAVTPQAPYRFVAWQQAGASLGDATLNPISVIASAPINMTAVLDGNLLLNGSFEDTTFPGVNRGDWSYLHQQYSIANWSHVANAGISTVNTPWVHTDCVPDGKYLAFLQNGATISQTFACTVPGYYELTFLACKRHGNGSQHTFAIEFDGMVVTNVTVSTDLLAPFVVEIPDALDFGSHTLTIGEGGTGSDAVALDLVELKLVAAVAAPTDILTINGLPDNYGASFVTPSYGTLTALSFGDSFVCSAPSGWFQQTSSMLINCVGYTIETNAPPALWQSGTTAQFTYTHGDSSAMLTWLWEKAFRVNTSVVGSGSISHGATAIPLGGDSFYRVGDTITLTAVPSGGSSFSRWSGNGLTPEQSKTNPLVLVATTEEISISAIFAQDIFVAQNGSDSNSGLNWDNAVATLGGAMTKIQEDGTINFGYGNFYHGTDFIPALSEFSMKRGANVFTSVGLSFEKDFQIGVIQAGHQQGTVYPTTVTVADLDIDVGSPASPQSLYIGWRAPGGGWYYPHGTVTVFGGSLDAYVTNFYVGVQGRLRDGSISAGDPVGRLEIATEPGKVVINAVDTAVGTYFGDAYSSGISGSVIATNAPSGVLKTESLHVGSGNAVEGEMLLGDDWTVSVGSSTARGTDLAIATAPGATAGTAKLNGTFRMGDGEFSSYSTNIQVAAQSAPSSSCAVGLLDLSEVTGKIVLDTEFFGVGYNQSHHGNGHFTRGTVDASNSNGGVLSFIDGAIGYGVSDGAVYLGSGWDVNIGSRADDIRGSLNIGRQGLSHPNFGAANGTFMATGPSGAFTVYCNTITVGYADASAPFLGTSLLDLGLHTGAIDIDAQNIYIGSGPRSNNGYDSTPNGTASFRTASTMTFNVAEGLYVGHGYRLTGTLALSAQQGGVGTASTVFVGDADSDATLGGEGRLLMENVALKVSTTAAIGVSGGMTNIVNGYSSGLHVLSSASGAFSVSSATTSNARGLSIIFAGAPEKMSYVSAANAWGADAMIYWGLAWAGDHVDELNTMIGDGKIVISTEGMKDTLSDKVHVFFDPGLGTEDRPFNTTYIGFHAKNTTAATILIVR